VLTLAPMTFFNFGNFGFGSRRSTAAAAAASTMPTTNLTALYYTQDDAKFSLTGDSINTLMENDNRGAGDLDFAFVSGTKAVKTATHPVNTSEETMDTNNADGSYQTPAGGTLADKLPSGTGTIYMKFYFDSHTDFFSAPDRIFYVNYPTDDLRISIVDGTQGKLQVRTNNGAQSCESPDLTVGGWYTACIRIGVGANQLKVKVNALAESTATGAAIVTLTGRPKLFGGAGDGGYFDGALAGMAFYDEIHDDTARDANMAIIDTLLAT